MAKQRNISVLSQKQKEFVKLIESVDYSLNDFDKFRDFCELTAMSLALPFHDSEKIRSRIKNLHDRYGDKGFEVFEQALQSLIDALEEEYHDFLGVVYMAIEAGNSATGQFFTPFPVCKMMAQMQLPSNIEEEIASKGGYITLSDPAVGAAALPIAAIDHFRKNDIDYSNKLYIVAQDIDLKCCYMAYIQLSLCGVAAEVINGNTLACDPDDMVRECWHTPVYFINDWPAKIALRRLYRNIRGLITPKGDSEPEQPLESHTTVTPDIKVVREKGGQLAFDFGIKEAV